MNLGISLLCLSFALYIFIWGGLKIRSFFPTHVQGSFIKTGFLYFPFILGNLFLSLFFPEVVSLRFWMISGIALLSCIFLEKQKNVKINYFLKYLLCLTVIFCLSLPEQGNILEYIKILGLSFFWWCSWQLFIFFNRFPFVSFILTAAWGLGIIFIGFVMKSFPLIISVQTLLLSAVLMPINQWCIKQKKLSYDSELASSIGFIWGGMLAYILWNGAIFQAVSFWGYYIFEGIFLLIAFLTRHPLNTLLDLAISKDGQKALKTLFFHILLLTALSGMPFENALKIWGLIWGVVFIDLYLKLKAIIQPPPSWKEVITDTKVGVIELFGKKQSRTKRKARK